MQNTVFELIFNPKKNQFLKFGSFKNQDKFKYVTLKFNKINQQNSTNIQDSNKQSNPILNEELMLVQFIDQSLNLMSSQNDNKEALSQMLHKTFQNRIKNPMNLI